MAIKCGVFKTTYEDDEAIWQTKVSKFWIALLLIVLIAFPFIFQGSRYLLYVVNSVLIAVIAAIGLNILTGFTGQISLGHGAFMGVGAYASGYFMTILGMPFWICVLAAGSVTAIVGMIFGIPSLRLKGLYLAIATLAAQVILEFVFVRWRAVTGGSQGMMVQPAKIGGISFNSDFKFYRYRRHYSQKHCPHQTRPGFHGDPGPVYLGGDYRRPSFPVQTDIVRHQFFLRRRGRQFMGALLRHHHAGTL
jgi:branched-chain amino acid transport system permease protein